MINFTRSFRRHPIKAIIPKTILLCLLLFCMAEVQASPIELGFKLGWISSEAEISRVIAGMNYKPIQKFSLGAHATLFAVKEQLALQPEVHISKKGFKIQEFDADREISSEYAVYYIEIPVLVVWRIPLRGKLRPGFVLGPYVGFATKVKEVQNIFGERFERSLDDSLEKTDIGITMGMNLLYATRFISLILEARYSHGFVNIANDITDASYEFQEDDTIKNRSFHIMFGVVFNLFP